MVRVALLGLAVAAAGCDQVFGLGDRDAGAGTVDAAACPYTQLAPEADADQDGVLNGVDACPLVPSHEPHDEDGDTVADACDPCPLVAEAGQDLDCDGIGAACDPLDTSPHVMEFFGFGSERGLVRTGDAVIEGDRLVFRQQTDDTAIVTAAGTRSPDGRYELHARLAGIDAAFFEVGFILDVAGGAKYQVELWSNDRIASLRIRDVNKGVSLRDVEIGTLGGTAEVTLRLDVTGRDLKLAATGSVAGEITAQATTAPGALELGAQIYRDPPMAAFRAELDYLLRIAPAP